MSAHSWLMLFRMLTGCVLVAGSELSSLSAQTREVSRAEQIQRTWRDASGLFVQEATLLELSAQTVKLRKGDGTIVDVRRELLSTADQNFLRELDKTRNPFMSGAVKESATTSVEKDSAGPKFSAGASTMPSRVGPDQAFQSPDLPPILPSAQKVVIYSPTTPLESLTTESVTPPSVPVGEAYLADHEYGARVSPILMLDPSTNKVAISAGPSMYSSRSRQTSQIFIGTLPRGPFESIVSVEDPLTLLDHNLKTGQTLATTGEQGEQGDRDLLLLEGLSDKHPKQIARFRLPADNGRRRQISQARLVGPNQAVVVLDRVAYCWDLKEGTILYQSEPQRGLTSDVAFSFDLKMMTIPSEIGIHFVSTETGKDLGFLPCKNMRQIQVAFDPRSQRIGYTAGDFWGVYDYQQRSSIEPQTTTWSLNGPMVGWIGPNWMLAGGGIVMDTEVHVPVWKYRSEKWAGAALWQDTVTMIDNSQGLRLRTLPMPHAEMQAAIESRPKLEELLATDQGSAVDLQFELPDPLPANVNREELERRMTEIVKRAGWLLSKEAELKLVVRIAPGKTRQEQYLKYVPNMTSARPEMIEVTPLISRLELRENGQPIWWMEHQNGARSPSYGPSPKEKAEHIKDRERAIPEYFYGIVLPTRIPRQPYTHGMGQSYDHHGLWEAQPIVP